MLLLAAVISGNKIAVIILCIAALVFLLVDGFLVISLHKHNNRLAKMEESEIKALPAPEELTKIKALPAPHEESEEHKTQDNGKNI